MTHDSVAHDLSLTGVLRVIRRHTVMVSAWTVLLLLIAVIVLMRLEPQFRAEATLALDTRVEHVSDLRSVVSTPFTLQDPAPIVRSEVQVLMSPQLAGEVVDKLRLVDNASFRPRSSTLMHAVAVAVQYGLTKCSEVLETCAVPRTLAPIPDAASIRLSTIQAYLKKLSVLNDGKSLILAVGFEDRDPKLAAEIANAHVTMYLEDQRAFKRRVGERSVTWVSQQVARLSGELRSKEQELLAFRGSEGLVAVQGSTVVAQQVTQIVGQLAQARADLAARQANSIETQGAVRRGASSTQSDVLGSPLVQKLRDQEAVTAQTLADLLQRYGESFPAIQQARLRLEAIRKTIAAETQRIASASTGDVTAARQRVAELENTLAGLREQLFVQENAAAHVAEIERDIAALRVVYQGLLGRQQELDAQVGTEDADAHIVSAASVPQLPFFPNKTILLGVAVVFAITSGIGLAFLIDRRPPTGFGAPSDLQKVFGDLTLHALPLIPPSRRRRRALADHLLDAPKAEFAEAIRSLRSDLLAAGRHNPARVLAVTSALPREGKTTVAIALARSMAASGLSVLLIDCDLRRPQAGNMIGVPSSRRGLLAVLQGQADLELAVACDPRSDLMVLAVEHPAASPQDLLASSEFSRLLQVARASYEFVILDTPPQAAVSDPLLVAERADATIVVVRWQSTPVSVVEAMMQSFQRRGARLDGIFLNGVDFRVLIRTDADLRTAYRSASPYYFKS